MKDFSLTIIRDRSNFQLDQMRKAARGLVAVVLSLLLAGCGYDRSVGVADVRKEEVIILSNAPNPEPVYAIDIRVSGRIEGDATIVLMLNDQDYKTEKLRGAVNFKWSGDWYTDAAEVRYTPDNVSSGELTIEYDFSTI